MAEDETEEGGMAGGVTEVGDMAVDDMAGGETEVGGMAGEYMEVDEVDDAFERLGDEDIDEGLDVESSMT